MKKKNYKNGQKKSSSFFKKSKFKFDPNKIKLDRLNNLGKYINESVVGRTVNNAGVVKQSNEFMFPDGGSVEVGTSYHIHYSPVEKKEIYMTGKKHNEVSQVITRLKGNTNFGKYINLTTPSSGMTYLPTVPFKFEVTKKNRKLQLSYRYFAKLADDNVTPEFEISQTDYRKNTPVYQKTQVKWSLDLSKDMMINKIIDEIDRIVGEGFKSLKYSLNPAEGHIEGDMSLREEKIEKLKKLFPKKKFGSPKWKKKKKKKNLFESDEIISKSTGTISQITEISPPGGSGY